jgi:hypothetical protein
MSRLLLSCSSVSSMYSYLPGSRLRGYSFNRWSHQASSPGLLSRSDISYFDEMMGESSFSMFWNQFFDGLLVAGRRQQRSWSMVISLRWTEISARNTVWNCTYPKMVPNKPERIFYGWDNEDEFHCGKEACPAKTTLNNSGDNSTRPKRSAASLRRNSLLILIFFSITETSPTVLTIPT